MTDTAARRPPILTGACVYLGALSAIIAFRAITVVSSWNSENRAADFGTLLRALRDAGLSAGAAETTYKTVLAVVAVFAACGVVFAAYTSRGHRTSRVGLTVAIGVSGVLTFVGVLGGSFFFAMLGALAVVFTIRLWTGEIRTYFRTLAGHAPPAPKISPPDPFGPSAHPPSEIETITAPVQAPTYRQPLPRAVSIAVWSAFIGSIAVIGLSALWLMSVLLLGLDYDAVIEQGGPGVDMLPSESEFDTAMRLMTVLASLSVVLGLGGLLASIRVLVTRRSGGVVLFVMTVVTLIFSVVGFPLGIPWTVVAIIALIQLRKPEARAWFVKT